MKLGENTVVIKVSAEDGSTKEYKIIVNQTEKQVSIDNDDLDTSDIIEKPSKSLPPYFALAVILGITNIISATLAIYFGIKYLKLK